MDALSWLSARSVEAASWMASAAMSETRDQFDLQKRAGFEDSYKIYMRKRNAHACIMSIVFIVLLPLGAISLHLPLQGVVRKVVVHTHVPFQLLGLVMMIGAMGLGIDMAKNDLHYFNPVKAHIVLGLVTTSIIILVQPAMGIIHHNIYKKTQKKSIFGYIHRYTGRITIIMGWVNSYLGFKLVGLDYVKPGSMARNFGLMGALGGVWFLLVAVDFIERHFFKTKKDGTPRRSWKEVVGGSKIKGQDRAASKSDLETDVEFTKA